MPLIPQNLEAEEALLGGMISSPRAIEAANDVGVVARDFYRPSHRLIYSAVKECAEKGAVDELTVVTHLRSTGQLKDAGGQVEVISLVERVPSIANARAYAEEVRAQSLLRQLHGVGVRIQEQTEAPKQPAETLIQYAVQEIDSVAGALNNRGRSKLATAKELSDWVVEHIDSPSSTTERFPYPLPTLQEHSGGFARGELVTVGGYSGDGKSVFALQMMEHCANNDLRVGYWSLEMPAHQVELRLISMLTGIPVLKLKMPWELDLFQKEAAKSAANKLRELDFGIYGGSLSSTQPIIAEQRRKKYDLLVLDHFHRLPDSQDTKTIPNSLLPLKDSALETECGVVNLVQLNRDIERGYPAPNPNRIKGGNAFMDESDAVLFVYRERDEYQQALLNGSVIVSKMRDGVSGYSIPVRLNPDRLRFDERKAA